ncbi:MAG TPA: class I SAM-dependent methyltransferase [Hanamia sp.]|nr:class I SAM-dependent methyltransferase [Hanamia sp.]
MNFFYYFKYFYFIARNWNPWLATFTVYHEIRGERKYDIHTIEIDEFRYEKIESNNLSHASIYQGSNYFILEKAFEYLKNENANNNILDFGSGKGRILVVAAHYGFKNITGIDFSASLCREADYNIEKIKSFFPTTNFKVICGDAINYTIENDTNVFFFFNPFDEVVMLQVVKNILSSLKQNLRKVYIVYVNPLHKEIFLSAGFEEEYFFRKMNFLEFSILSKQSEEESYAQ